MKWAPSPVLLSLVLLWSVFLVERTTSQSTESQRCEDTHTCEAFVAVCAVMKNEHPYVLEWLEYHAWLGFGRFYIFDNYSDPPLSEMPELRSFVDKGVLTINPFHDFSPYSSPQTYAYNTCVSMYGNQHVFMLFIDADEFVVIDEQLQSAHPDITSVLSQFKQHGALKVHWKLFGSSGHVARPRQHTSVMANYVRFIPQEEMQRMLDFRANPGGHMKAFVHTKYVVPGSCDPHGCVVEADVVKPNHEALTMESALQLSWDTLSIHHYVTKSYEDFKSKISRGSAHSMYVTSEPGKTMGYFGHIDSHCFGIFEHGKMLNAACCQVH